MLYATSIALLLGFVAIVLERLGAVRQLPSRGIWLAGIAVAMSVPPLAAFRHASDSLVVPAPRAAGPGSGPLARPALAVSHNARFDLSRLDAPLAVAWAVLSLALLTSLSRASLAQRRSRRSWSRTLTGGTPVLVASDAGPAVLGVFRLEIVLPQWALALPEVERRMIMAHEDQHRRTRDPNVLMLGVAALVLTPWNPAMWWMLRRLRLAIETEGDRRVLRAGTDAHAYGTLLLNVCHKFTGVPVVANAAFTESSSLLERRIDAMTSPQPRRPVLQVAACAVVAGLLVAAACNVPQPNPIAPLAAQGAVLFSPLPADRGPMLPPPEYSKAQLQSAIATYFPDVLRGTRGEQPLWFLVDSDGRVVATARGPTHEESAYGRNMRAYEPQLALQRFPRLNTGRVRQTIIASWPAGFLAPEAVETFFVRLRAPSDSTSLLVISQQLGN
jgi:beta-lactamase regulating signal transducer with metallopeptidase domain